MSFYGTGKTTPCKTVSNSTWSRVYFGAFDSKGNLFVDGSDANGNVLVGEVTGDCKATTITTLKVGNAIAFPGGIQITNDDDVAIEDQEGAAIYTYKPPANGSLGKPIATTPLKGASDPVTFAFTSTGTDLWTSDAGLIAADEFAYPKGGSPIASIKASLSEPIGVAVIPAEVP